MSLTPERRQQLMLAMQETQAMQLAFIGLTNGLLQVLAQKTPALAPQTLAPQTLAAQTLAAQAGVDAGYVVRWCDAAYAFGLLDEPEAGCFTLTEDGRAFLPGQPGSLMPMAVGAVLGAHMAERAATLMKSGVRPGEQVLAERESILPWFGPMLEASFSPVFEQEILPGVPAFAEINQRQGLAVDLGCGNGWYLRRLAKHMPGLRGLGLDGFGENVRQATQLAQAAGLGQRLSFREGDIYRFTPDVPVDLVAMNRALHHVWDKKNQVFGLLRDMLKPGGYAVIWEPNWPEARTALRHPSRRPMAMQNLMEHIQGNHFLNPDLIVQAFAQVDMKATVHLFAQGNEMVVVGQR